MNISTAGVKKDGLPDGFVYIDEVIEDAIIDAKYWGTDNFVGRRIDGYERPLVAASREVAEGCAEAAKILRERSCFLKIYDAYRPQRAVEDFVRWAADLDDVRRKPIHYPRVNKKVFFAFGYIAGRSGHTRGCAVDLTLVDMGTRLELDMGSTFDFMDARSQLSATGLTERQEANRALLSGAMLSCGFEPYESEWWHFSLKEEPYPDTYFDFPIR
jgi:D-alanyl-D-alanine dipeptidase